MESHSEKKQKPAWRQWTLTRTHYTLKRSFGPEGIGSLPLREETYANRWQKKVLNLSLPNMVLYSKVITRHPY